MKLHRLLLVTVVSSAVAFAAACAKSTSTPSTPSSTTSSCSVTLGTVTTSVSGAASTGTLPVTAASTCAWTAASSASFLTITSGATGTGNGTVGYSIAANTGAARSASITVNGSTVNFTQAAPLTIAPNGCTISVSPTTIKANSGGGTVTVNITSASTCSWAATSNSSFLTVPSTTTTGNGTLDITAAANTGAARSGTITVGGQTVTVTQDTGIVASFAMTDPAQTVGDVTVCQIRYKLPGLPAGATTCTLRSTSFIPGTSTGITYRWFVQYTYGEVITLQQTSTSPTINITETCEKTGGGTTDDGTFQPLSVQLVVSDSQGNSSTANAGQGSQPALQLQLFNCNR